MLMKDHASDIGQISSLFRLILRDYQVFGRKFLGRSGLTLSQYHILSLLTEQKEAKMRSLKEYLAVTGPVATKVVDNLINKKLVDRGRWGQDKREVHVRATHRGKALVRGLELKKKEFFRVLLDFLSFEEAQNLLKILNHLSMSLAEQNRVLRVK